MSKPNSIPDRKYLVWVRFNGMTYPQVWYYRPGKKIEESMVTIVAQWEVAAEDYALDVDALAKKYRWRSPDMKKIICWFMGHHWLLVLKDVGTNAEVGYYECERCKRRDNYFF